MNARCAPGLSCENDPFGRRLAMRVRDQSSSSGGSRLGSADHEVDDAQEKVEEEQAHKRRLCRDGGNGHGRRGEEKRMFGG